jgi:simple sugar transport system ATP-binding protein
VGRDLEEPTLSEGPAEGPVILETRGLSVRGSRGEWAVRNVSLSVRSGEILGLAGVMGNGQSELEEALAGLRPPEEGSVVLHGRDVTGERVRRRRDLGLAYIPEDRIRTGLAPLGRLWENLLMGHQDETRFRSWGFLRKGAISRFSRKAMEDFRIMAPGEMTQAGTLSGGNMQKVVLAREMNHRPSCLLVCQPTRGVDVGGIAFIRRMILEQRNRGAAILLVSSDLDEILALSDRVGIMYRGSLAAVLDRQSATRERVGQYMLEGKATA